MAAAAEPDSIARTFREAERSGLAVAMQGRLVALVLVGLWMGLTRPFPQNLVILAVIFAFVAIGLAQWLLIATGHDRPWFKYAFATVDAALLGVALATADLSLIIPGLPPIMLYRFDIFPFLLLPVAAAAFAYSPGLVAWTGVTVTAAWDLAWLAIVAPMQRTVSWEDMSRGGDVQAYLANFFDADFIGSGSRVQESLMLLIATGLIAIAVHRARQVVRRQAEAERQRDEVVRTFGAYVPEAVAARLIADRGALAPVQRTATVLFVDIAGFTATAESMPPGDVVAMLNAYFDAVAQIVGRHGGVITQFQGDGVLATFNVPVEMPGHARQAVEAALDIIGTVAGRRFNGIAIAVRAGINTGDLMAGSVGGAGRLSYTVHGDAVNLAARLEALNKEHGTTLLVTESVVVEVGADFAFRAVGQVAVRGKTLPIALYALDR